MNGIKEKAQFTVPSTNSCTGKIKEEEEEEEEAEGRRGDSDERGADG